MPDKWILSPHRDRTKQSLSLSNSQHLRWDSNQDRVMAITFVSLSFSGIKLLIYWYLSPAVVKLSDGGECFRLPLSTVKLYIYIYTYILRTHLSSLKKKHFFCVWLRKYYPSFLHMSLALCCFCGKRIIYRDNDDSQHLLKASLDRPPPRQSAKHFTCTPSFNPYATVCNAGWSPFLCMRKLGPRQHEFCVLGHLFFQDVSPQVSFAPKPRTSGCTEQGCGWVQR